MIPVPIRNALTIALAAVLVYVVVASSWNDPFFPAMVFGVGAAYFVCWAFAAGPLQFHFILIPLGAMALLGWLPNSRASYQWTAYFVLAFLAVQLFGRARLRTLFLQFALWFGAAYSAFAMVHANGTFANRNHFAAFLELLLPIACWEGIKTRKAIYAGAAALLLGAIVASASRAGIVLAGAELVFLTVAALGRGGRVRMKTVMAAAAAAIAIAALLGGTAWNRFGDLASDATHSSRALTARASLAMLRERPLTGFGLGTWEATYPHFAETDIGFHIIHADNDWLEWAAEGGLPFIGFVLLLAAIAVKNCWHEPWSVGLAAVLVHGLTEFPLQKPAVMSWFVVLLATSAMARRQH